MSTTSGAAPKTRSDKSHRILIVDDHPLVRRGLGEAIGDEADMEVCGEAGDSAEAMRQVEETHPDLVIIDISLKSGSGIELIKQIKARFDDVRMLVSSMHDEVLFAERALRAGAMGYISKQEAPDKVVEAIRLILKGKVYLSPQMSESMLNQVVGGKKSQRSPMERLSDRELEVFELIGQGHTTREIAEKLHLSVKTIETHRERLKRKLNLASGHDLLRRAIQWMEGEAEEDSAEAPAAPPAG